MRLGVGVVLCLCLVLVLGIVYIICIFQMHITVYVGLLSLRWVVVCCFMLHCFLRVTVSTLLFIISHVSAAALRINHPNLPNSAVR